MWNWKRSTSISAKRTPRAELPDNILQRFILVKTVNALCCRLLLANLQKDNLTPLSSIPLRWMREQMTNISTFLPWMKEVTDNIWGRGGPTYAARSKPQYISAFPTRVLPSTYIFVKGERSWSRIYKLFRTPGINSTKWADWFWKPFIFLVYSYYYICRQKWFPGNFCSS